MRSMVHPTSILDSFLYLLPKASSTDPRFLSSFVSQLSEISRGFHVIQYITYFSASSMTTTAYELIFSFNSTEDGFFEWDFIGS